MDDFPGLLARDFGFKPQGKSAPMAPPARNSSGFASPSYGSEPTTRSASSLSSKSAPIFDDHDHDRVGGGGGGGADGLMFNDVFGGPPKYGESRGGGGGNAAAAASSSPAAAATSFDYDAIFKDQNAKSSSLPVFDKPVYDDDIFDGLPGLKSTAAATSSSAKFDDVFAAVGVGSSSPKHKSMNSSSAFDDLLGNLGKKGTETKREAPSRVEKDSPAFDDLLPGFGRSTSPSISRSTSESSRSTRPSTNSAKTAPATIDDPFVVLESTSTPAAATPGGFPDPLEEIGRFNSSGSAKVDSSRVHKGSFDDLDPLENLGKSVPSASSQVNERRKNRSPLRSEASMGDSFSPVSQDPVDKYPVENSGRYSQNKAPIDDFQETPFGPTESSKAASGPPPSYASVSANETFPSPVADEVTGSADDIWLTVSEIPLFTNPTSAPPPSRPPPPRPPRSNARKKFNEYSFSRSQSPKTAQASRSSASPIDELEDFAMGRAQNNNNVNEHADTFASDDVDANSSSAAASAAAMKDAMDKAEAKFRHMREREHLKAARSKDSSQQDKDMLESQQRELRERQERLERERQQREKEEEDREQRKLREIEREEKEREQKRQEREREQRLERDRARQAVERATREARERAAIDARNRAERAAVDKASSEARERAERAAVQRAQAEARERAAADAKERAERAAAEARERANAEKERDARARSERAAVERAAQEARERAAAAAARANQQKYDAQPKHENDLESFFSSRPGSAPRPRATNSDPFFDTANKGPPEPPKRTSVGSTANMRKASSTTNIVDDLSSIFGASGGGQSGDFQEVEGETEDRRRARLERHHRTQERAKQALAEKNQRDLQAQREQEERHKIGETLDFEIKRWAAGKEGNLRALLSTLQYVLWPECGWQPISLTDLITGASVKKAYRKATLCIHPDKVQQKGANLQQKYIAEKVFDLLKEAWNKFNSEELF